MSSKYIDGDGHFSIVTNIVIGLRRPGYLSGGGEGEKEANKRASVSMMDWPTELTGVEWRLYVRVASPIAIRFLSRVSLDSVY